MTGLLHVPGTSLTFFLLLFSRPTCSFTCPLGPAVGIPHPVRLLHPVCVITVGFRLPTRDGGQPVFVLARARASTISPSTKSSDHFRAYSPTLPLCLRTVPTVPTAEVPTLVRNVYAMRHRAQDRQLGYRLTVAFRGPRFQSISLTHWRPSTRIARSTRSWLIASHPDAPSTGAITGLSYPTTWEGCPSQCFTLQISPQDPDASRRPQQPTCGVRVVPFPAPLGRDFHPFVTDRVSTVSSAPVSVSPNPSRIRVRIGSNEGVSPPSALRLPRQLHYEHAASAMTARGLARSKRLPVNWRSTGLCPSNRSFGPASLENSRRANRSRLSGRSNCRHIPYPKAFWFLWNLFSRLRHISEFLIRRYLHPRIPLR